MRTGRINGPILTIYTSYVFFSRTGVPFGVFVDMTPIKEVKTSNIPKKVA